MSKSKRKGFKNSKPASELLDSAALGLKKFRRFAKQVKKLSTSQKVVGGLALLAAGYAFISNSTQGGGAAEALASNEPNAPDAGATPVAPAGSSAPLSTPKPKRSKPAGSSKHSPFSEERP